MPYVSQVKFPKEYFKQYNASHRKERYAWTKLYRQRYPEYRIFFDIRSRCNNPKNKCYYLYGGRGIKCLIQSAQEFLQIVGKRPNNTYSIDRIDNNGHYEKGNLRWATKTEQAHNTRWYKGIK